MTELILKVQNLFPKKTCNLTLNNIILLIKILIFRLELSEALVSREIYKSRQSEVWT